MLLNGTPFNFVPFNQPELAPLGVFINDTQPVQMSVSGIGYLTTAIIPIQDNQAIRTSTTFKLVIPYHFTTESPVVGIGLLQGTTINYGWKMPTADPVLGVGLLQYPSNIIGQHFESQGETGIGITQEATVRINFHEEAGFSDYAVGKLQVSTVKLGYRGESDYMQGYGITQTTYTSVGTNIISFTGAGRIVTSIGPVFAVFYSGIRISPDPAFVKLTTIEDQPRVILGTVTPRNLTPRIHTSTSFSASPVLSTVRPRLKPSHIITKAEASVKIYKRPEPLIIAASAGQHSVITKAGNVVVHQATLKLSPQQAPAIATSTSGGTFFTTAIVEPAPAMVHLKALRGTEFQEVVVEGTASMQTSASAEIKWAPYVVDQQVTIQTNANFGLYVGSIVVDVGVIPPVSMKVGLEKVVQTTLTIEDHVTSATSASGDGLMGSMAFSYEASAQVSVANDPVFLTTAVLKPEPASITTSAGGPKIQMPPLVLDNEFQGSVQTDSEGDVLLGTINASFVSAKIKTTAEGQFKRGTASPYKGGPVVDTDDRHILNVEPLNKPGLRSINIQN